MNGSAAGSGPIVVDADPDLAARVDRLSRFRMVFFAGLPGTGKSLLVHQLAHLARAAGRTIHLLQWDVARPVFETAPAGRRYPSADGVTHPVIRMAGGRWARRAIGSWNRRYPEPAHLLVGETPFIGHRFIELARRMDDEAEPLLRGASCRFAVPVPSVDVRRFLETQRERRALQPLHPREREDAAPSVLRALWWELHDVAVRLGIAPATEPTTAGRVGDAPAARAPELGGSARPSFDPRIYLAVYERLLRHRNIEILMLERILPTERLSTYSFAVSALDLTPTGEEVGRGIAEVERLYAEPPACPGGRLQRDIACWWEV